MKNRLLYWLLAVLGFSIAPGCGMVEEYGTPHVNFTVKGNVTDESSNPIKGIKVEFAEEGNNPYGNHTLSDNQGVYSITDTFMSTPGSKGSTIIVTAYDIDGEENGLFKTAEKKIVVYGNEFTGGNKNWYNGAATKTVDFKLEKDTGEPEE